MMPVGLNGLVGVRAIALCPRGQRISARWFVARFPQEPVLTWVSRQET